MARTVLVTGASGFIGSHLATQLEQGGHRVRAMTRHPDTYKGAGEPVFGDVADPASLRDALDGCEAAYYLVHSLESDNFEEKDAEAAHNFGSAAAQAGLERIVYLGGLGKDDGELSAHLRSRREVERLLPEAGVPVTVLRAAVVIGHGGISWEITRQLVAHLPVMVTPRWVRTRTQPIALPDILRYLAGVLEPEAARGQTYEVGGPEVLRYIDMLQRAAKIMGKTVPSVTLPLLTPHLSSMWLSLVTDVDTPTARNLVDSMINEVVVTDRSIEDVVPGPTIGYDESVRLALAEREKALTVMTQPAWVTSVRRALEISLVEKVPRDHLQPDSEFRRRRIVVAVVLVIGATLLGISLNVRAGSSAFYPLTFGLAAVWAVGGFLSGPLYLGYLPFRGTLRRPLVTGFALGVIASAVFLVGALIVRQIPFLNDFVVNVLDHARYGSTPVIALVTVVNGIAEEIFFRGGLFAAIGREHPVLISTTIYAVATIATLNLMLVFAAVTLGFVLALQRRASGGILAPIITHVTWSVLMLFLLPPLFT